MISTQWINRDDYPFKSNYLKLNAGKMHYVDEGKGEPIVMIHGNPTWSYLYRHAIKDLSKTYRCIAPDHLGFGLSDKPVGFSYLPEDHAQNLQKLIDHLQLKNTTLVVQDWGGPIGLSYAVNNPGNVKRLVIMNTWMWPVKGDPNFEKFSSFMGGPVGKFLILNFNFFARFVMKTAYADKSKLTPEIHRHYKNVLRNKTERTGCWIFPKAIIGSTEWLSQLWDQREKIKDKPALLLWGMKDIAFKEKELLAWENLFLYKQVKKLENIGHFVQEELADQLSPLIEDFIKANS